MYNLQVDSVLHGGFVGLRSSPETLIASTGLLFLWHSITSETFAGSRRAVQVLMQRMTALDFCALTTR